MIPSETSRLVAEGGLDFHTPSLADFFPDAILFAGTPFEFNRIQLIRLIVVVGCLAITYAIASRAKVVPGRIQSVFELFMGFVRDNAIEPVLGKAKGRRFAPMLYTLFFLILAMNLAGVTPGLNLAGTSVIGMPFLLAMWTFGTYVYCGMKQHGFLGYFKHETMPPGVPKPVYILLAPIEFLQLAVVRWFSLTVRLLANMVAGHMMLVVFISLSQALLFSGTWLIAATPFAGAFALGIFGFEIFVALLQAFIFTVLSAVYINMATSESH